MQHLTRGDLRQQLARAQQPLRFGLVGLSGVLVNSMVLWLLVQRAGLAVPLASALATEVAILTNFLLNDNWTFAAGQRNRPLLQRLLRYNGVAMGGLLITATALTLLTALGGLPLLAANLLAVLCAMAWNYLANRRWTWGERRAARAARPASGAARLALLALLAGGAWLVLGMPGAWATLACLLLSMVFVARPGVEARRAATLALAVAVAVSSVDYLAWRASVINWWNWWVSLPLFVAELFGALHTLGLQYTAWPRDAPALADDEDPTRRPIFIFVPTVDEGPEVLGPTLRGTLAARARYLAAHPHGRVTIVVCNDGYVAGAAGWEQTEALAAELGVICITRRAGGGAKAGNIEHARQTVGATGDALLAIFDADQIAAPEFLLRMVGPMSDARVGWVQSGQYYYNLENPVARWANDQQALFYKVLCPGKSAQNAAFICGTNVLLRAAALDEIGGLPQDSVTEDFAASIEMQPRWRSVFIEGELAHGIGPLSLASYMKQQGRWARGTLGVLRSHWRQIFLPSQGGLSLAQRVQYALACTHYLSGLRDLVYLLAPLVFLAWGAAAVRGAFLSTFLWHFLPYWLIAQIAFWQLAWGKTSMRGIVLGFGSFPVLIDSLAAVISGRRVSFTVTAKRREAGGALRLLRPYLLAATAGAAAIGVALLGGRGAGPALVSVAWVLYTLAMLGAMIWLGWSDRAGSVARPRPATRRPVRRLLRPAMTGAAAALTLGILAGFMPAVQATTVAPFTPSQAGRPAIGVSLPYDRLSASASSVAGELGRPLGIVGRTQDISDRFDSAWAAGVRAKGGRPWVTLLFAIPDRPAYEASLPAIANGFHDANLRRWARAMRAYGAPVYLSVLPHVDRNWAVSSAVTNGGIPQDVPRAWAHIRQVLREEGAANVALVWSPADPADDAAYAPPEASIDAVLLSLISYPDQEWADPAAAIAAAQARHPATPLLLEVSAAGEPARKADWLRAVGAAAAQSRGVRALIYHDGAPDPRATPAEHARWSLDSDPQSLAAMRAALGAAEVAR